MVNPDSAAGDVVAYPSAIPVVMLSALAFAVPFLLGHPQPVVGSVVNAALFLSALYVPERYHYGFVVLPSLAVILRGAVFGPMTPFLLYLAPFIWMGNLLMVRLFTAMRTRVGFAGAACVASVAKTALLFASAYGLVGMHVIPRQFLVAMGPLQLGTALGGALIAYAAVRGISYGSKDKRT